MCRLIILGFISLFLGTAHAASQFDKIKPLLFQVKTVSPGQSEKTSYGTGFVVNKDGLLATNFHVVADHVWKPKKYNIVVEMDTKDIDAEVVGIDIINDLALVKVNFPFPDFLRLNLKAPPQGQDVLSYGLPEDLNWTVVRGTYNGILEQGPYKVIHLSAPLNHGMSGGPTVNLKGEVIGVNSAGRAASQEISFAVPVAYLENMIQKYQKTKKKKTFIEVIEDQAIDLQDEMVSQLTQAFRRKKTFRNWKIPLFDKSIRCWGLSSSFDIEKQSVESARENCSVENNIYIDGERTFGTFQVEVLTAKNHKLSPWAWLNFQSHEFLDNFDLVPYFQKDSVINFEKGRCQRNILFSKHKGVKNIASVCIQKITPFKDLYDGYVTFQMNDDKQLLRVSYSLSGFSKKSINLVTQQIINYNYGFNE